MDDLAYLNHIKDILIIDERILVECPE